ncbi:MAG: hypothetical protein QOF68_1902, partial [Gaiellales bacterium]|nr:hypothetical protein [Gaiellales bacterium]
MAADVSRTSIAFGNQKVGTTSATETVTITNNDGVDIVIGGVAVGNPADYEVGGTCGGTLPNGQACTITVAFDPEVVGLKSDSVAFNI